MASLGTLSRWCWRSRSACLPRTTSARAAALTCWRDSFWCRRVRSIHSFGHCCSSASFGPGALAGTLAIAFRSIGFVGKLLGEALEEADRGPIEALNAAALARLHPGVRLLAAGKAGVLVDSLSFGGTSTFVNPRCWDWWAGGHRHDARCGDEPVSVESRRDRYCWRFLPSSCSREIVVTFVRKRVL